MADTIGTRFGDRARKWTAEEDEYLVRRLRKEGATYTQVGIELGRPRCSIAGRIGRLEKGMINLQEASDAKFIALFNAGKSRQEMAEALGITVNAVNKRVGGLRKRGMIARPERKPAPVAKPKAKRTQRPGTFRMPKGGNIPTAFDPGKRLEAKARDEAKFSTAIFDRATKPHLAGIPLERLDRVEKDKRVLGCRYACNDADIRAGEEHLFCGAPKVDGRSYCTVHLAICEVKYARAAA